MTEPTLPTNPEGQYYTGSFYLANGTSSDTGNGSIYLSNGDLLVDQGVSSFQATYIHTNDLALTIDGSGGIDAQVSGDILFQTSLAAANAIRLNATNASGNVVIDSAGSGSSAIDLNASAGGITADATGDIALTSTSSNGTAIDLSASSGGIDIDANTTISATAGGLMTLESTSTSSGAVTINANANGASLVLNATGTGNDIDINANDAVTVDSATLTSTQTSTSATAFSVVSSGGVSVQANDSTNGKFVVTAAGAAADAISLTASASNATTKIVLDSAGTGASAVDINSAGGVDVDAVGAITLTSTATGTATVTIDSTGEVKIDSSDTTNGIKIGTETSGVPVRIGTAASVTTIVGDLDVQGTTTSINTETLVVEDNLIQLNYAGGSLGIDSGVVIRRYQTANASGAGNVVENSTTSDTFVPQESGAFQAGSSTPGTLVLAAHASATDDFYNGWWIRITSGAGSGQVRRIKDYTGSTRTATLFVTADNTSAPVVFNDGLDLVTAPSASDTYELYNQNSIALYWDESTNYYKLAGVPDSDLPGTSFLTANDNTLQYTDLNTGVVKINPKKHRNMQGSASTTTITMTLKDVTERVQTGHKVMIEDSSGFTPSINGTYIVTGTTSDTFTFTVAASTTSAAGANASVSFLNTSKLYVNTIELNDPTFGSITIPGLPYTEDIIIANTSTTPVPLTAATTNNYGTYFIIIQDISTGTNQGAMATFSLSKSNNGNNGDVNRLASSRGDENQRLLMDWPSGANRPRVLHSPAGSTVRNNTYRVRVYSIL